MGFGGGLKKMGQSCSYGWRIEGKKSWLFSLLLASYLQLQDKTQLNL
jgi:hypothetical protein